MDVRQTLNDNPVYAGVVAAVVILLALGFAVLRTCSSPSDPARGAGPTRAYFSTDDGKTYFVDDVMNIPPYRVNRPGDPNNGKVAVRARVVRCKDGPPYVAALETYPDAEKKRLEQILQQQGEKAKRLPLDYMNGASAMMKKPGTGKQGWLTFSANTSEQWRALAVPTCPDGSKAEVVEP